MRSRCVAMALLGAALGSAPAAAQGVPDDSVFPVRLVNRPTVLPGGTWRGDAFGIAARAPGSPATGTMVLGGGVGLGWNLEAGGQLVPVQAGPEVLFTTPSLYLAWAPPTGRVTVEPILQAVVPVRAGEALTLDAIVDLTYLVGPQWQVGFGPAYSYTDDDGTPGATLTLPLSLTAQLGRTVAAQLSSGAAFERVEPRFDLSRSPDPLDWNEVSVPVDATLIWTLAAGAPARPLADLSLQWQWPQLWAAGAESGWNARDWALQLQLSRYRVGRR